MMSSEDLGHKVQVLLEEISDLKTQVCSLVVQGHEDFLKSSASILALAASSSSLSSSADALRLSTAASLPQLSRTAKEQRLVASQLDQLGLVQEALEAIIRLHKLLHALEERLDAGEVWQAVEITAEVRRLLPTLTVRKEDVRVFEALRTTFLELKDRVRAALDQRWAAAVSWPDADSLLLALPPQELQRLLGALASLDEVRARLSQLVKRLVDRLLLPAVRGELTLSCQPAAGLRLVAERPASPPPPVALLGALAGVLEELSRALFGLEVEAGRTVADLTRYALQALPGALVEHCLQQAVPASQEEVDRFREEVGPEAARLEAAMQRWGMVEQDERRLSQYVAEIDKLFLERKREAILIQCRELMKKSLFDITPVGEENCQGDPSSDASVTFFPRCLVSRSLLSMLALLDAAVEQLVGAQSAEYKSEVFQAVHSAVEMYPRVIATVHADALAAVPQAAAIFHCNCMYLAHRCLFDFRLARVLPRASFLHLVKPLRAAANDALLAQMRRQRDAAQETLATAGDLHEAAEKAGRLSGALQLTCRQLGVLSRVWRVLPQHVFGQVMGAVFNHVCQRFISDLTAIADISTDDGDTLLELFRFLREHGLALFRVPEAEDVPQKFSFADDDAALSVVLTRLVQAWPKVDEAIFVLDSGLVAISERWAGGKGPLAEAFSVAEMKALVRALFQNTEKRAAVLAKIR